MTVRSRITIKDADQRTMLRNKLSDRVLDMLMEMIMSGELKMGEQLKTEDLANQLGVSRMPIREALKELEKKGLAETIPYIGTKLVKLTGEDVRQIYLARAALEPITAKYACERITDEEIRELEKIHEDYKKIVNHEPMDAIELYQQNRLFHFSIYRASKLDRINEMVESLWDTLSFFKLIFGRKLMEGQESKSYMIREHGEYLQLVKDRKGDELGERLRENLLARAKDIPFKSGAYFDTEEDDGDFEGGSLRA